MRRLNWPKECRAIVGQDPPLYKIVRYQRCQGAALAVIGGVPLCGVHINAISEGPIIVLAELEHGPKE